MEDELPRTIVIRADGTRIAISGELSAQQLQRIESDTTKYRPHSAGSE